jgi:hypothetical protein
LGFGGQGYIAAILWAIFVLIVYFVLGVICSPVTAADHVDWLPPVCYALLIMTVLTFALSMLSLPFDKWRLSVVPTVAVVAFVLFGVFRSDHWYEVWPRAQGWTDLPTPNSVVRAWRSRNPEAKYMTIVAASGGGIKAALWTGRVLEKMAEARAELPKSIVLVSSTSGGSVGAMYFQEVFTPEAPPTVEALRSARAAAGRSSLSASVWGLAYPDLWRVMSGGAFPWGRWRIRDRGWALDRRWELRRRALADTLSSGTRGRLGDWIVDVNEGWRPAQVFNVTVAESGAPLRIASVDLGPGASPQAPGSVPHEFSDLYPWSDIEVATAARLSATFAWVSPMTRPWMQEDSLAALIAELDGRFGSNDPNRSSVDRLRRLNADNAFRLADGGYFDNFGLHSAIEFLKDIGPDTLRNGLGPGLGINRVLIVEIRASGERPQKEKEGGLAYSLFGPILAMNNVRSSSQIARNDQQLESLRDLWERDEVTICRVVFTMTELGPLSWQLSEAESQAVLDSWDDEEDQKMKKVGHFLDFQFPPDEPDMRPDCRCPTWKNEHQPEGSKLSSDEQLSGKSPSEHSSRARLTKTGPMIENQRASKSS